MPEFEATAYVAEAGALTASGIPASAWGPVKIMAVDPEVLELGKCYTVQFSDEHTSVYLAADTGGDVKGHRVDLLLRSVTSAKKFGRQTVKIFGPTACATEFTPVL